MDYIEALKDHLRKTEIKIKARGGDADLEYELNAVRSQIRRLDGVGIEKQLQIDKMRRDNE